MEKMAYVCVLPGCFLKNYPEYIGKVLDIKPGKCYPLPGEVTPIFVDDDEVEE